MKEPVRHSGHRLRTSGNRRYPTNSVNGAGKQKKPSYQTAGQHTKVPLRSVARQKDIEANRAETQAVLTSKDRMNEQNPGNNRRIRQRRERSARTTEAADNWATATGPRRHRRNRLQCCGLSLGIHSATGSSRRQRRDAKMGS